MNIKAIWFFVLFTNCLINSAELQSIVDATNFCFQCLQRRNHKDLYGDPNDCHFYYQCVYESDGLRAFGIRRSCPNDQFWNDKILQCVPEGPVPCEDKCLANLNNQQRVSCFGSPTSCSSFFVCSNTISYPFCCPPNTRFNASSCQCDKDDTCADSCSLPTTRPATARPSVIVNQQLGICQDSYGAYLQAVLDNLNKFNSLEIHDPSNVNFTDSTTFTTVTLSCASGSQFNLDTCQCSNFVVLGQNPTPSPVVLYLPFEGDANDQSSSKFVNFLFGDVELVNSTAAHGTGSLSVNGGRLEIPGLKTFALGQQASWCLFYRCQNDNCSSNGGLLSNSKDSPSGEFSIKIASQVGNQVTASVGLFNPDGAVQVSGSVGSSSSGQFTQVCVIFTGSKVQLYVNKQLVQSVSTPNGDVKIGHCPYVIGTDQAIGEFHGFIDDVVISNQAFTPDQIAQHFEGRQLKPPTIRQTGHVVMPNVVESDVVPDPEPGPFSAKDLDLGNALSSQKIANGKVGFVDVGKIYAGAVAPANKFPFAVFIRIFWKSIYPGYRFCTGSLLNDRWVITAAHCLWPRVPADQLVRVELYLGTTDISQARSGGSSTQWITSRQGSAYVKNYRYVHESYDPATKAQSPFDVALIKMDSPVKLGDGVQTVKLPDEATGLCHDQGNNVASVDGYTKVVVAGWGATESRGISDKLLYTQLQVISRTECSQSWSVFAGQFCAYGIPRGVSDTCSGDSGAPTIVTINGIDYLIGTVAFGAQCADPSVPGVYTRICYITDWIRSTING